MFPFSDDEHMGTVDAVRALRKAAKSSDFQEARCLVSSHPEAVGILQHHEHSLIDCHPYMLVFLAENGWDIRQCDSMKQNFLHAAAEHPDGAAAIEKLCAMGVDVNAKDNVDASPLFHAHHLATLEALLKNGANPNLPNNIGDTPLFLSGVASSADAVRMLVAFGADCSIRNNTGETALHSDHNPEALRAIIAAGGDVHAADRLGRTPLHVARGRDDAADALMALIECGADVTKTDNNGDTPDFLHRGDLGRILLSRRDQKAIQAAVTDDVGVKSGKKM